MGRFPYLILLKSYLTEIEPYYKESTMQEMTRKLRWIHTVLQDLKAEGKARTTSPKMMKERDIAAFIGWCNDHLDSSTTRKYLGYFERFLGWCGNPVFQQMRLKKHIRIPKPKRKSIRALSQRTMDTIKAGADKIDGWDGAVAGFALEVYSVTGLRVSELRLARVDDLDLKRWRLKVSHPKGDGSWASPDEEVPIPESSKLVVSDFLAERREMLDRIGVNQCGPLIPFFPKNHGEPTHWSEGMWRKLKRKVVEVSGIPFRWKDLRPTFAQICKDKGMDIELISKMLRHTSIETTQRYYARIRSEVAFEEFERIWDTPTISVQKTAN